jgi:hypothetical protein
MVGASRARPHLLRHRKRRRRRPDRGREPPALSCQCQRNRMVGRLGGDFCQQATARLAVRRRLAVDSISFSNLRRRRDHAARFVRGYLPPLFAHSISLSSGYRTFPPRLMNLGPVPELRQLRSVPGDGACSPSRSRTCFGFKKTCSFKTRHPQFCI